MAPGGFEDYTARLIADRISLDRQIDALKRQRDRIIAELRQRDRDAARGWVRV